MDVWLDPRRRRETCVISHARADHTARHHRPVITPNTRLLLDDYLSKASSIVLDYDEPLETERFRLTLHPASHCLGSAQVLVESKMTGERLLYAGDFKVRPSPTNEPVEQVACDTLVMEATYGKSQYTFPPQEQVLPTAYRTLRAWLSQGGKPIVQGWRLGKAQEILYHLLAEGFDVAVEQGIYRVAEAYQKGGVTFPGEFLSFDGHWPEGRVAIWPPGRTRGTELERFRPTRFLELTGWAADDGNRWGCRGAASLPFSDHPDFEELVDYVRRVKPKQVYTVNGFPELAAHLRQPGIPGDALGRPGRTARSWLSDEAGVGPVGESAQHGWFQQDGRGDACVAPTVAVP